jgi:hypothetical protein
MSAVISSETKLDDLEVVEQIWAVKIEFILALRKFQKTGQPPIKKPGDILDLQQVVSKRVSNLCNVQKPRRTKIKEYEEIKNDTLDESEPPLIEKRKTMFKIFVEKALMPSNSNRQSPKTKSSFIKCYKKVTQAKKIIDLHKVQHSMAIHYRLANTPLSQHLLENISMNIHSLNKYKANFSIEKSFRLGKLLIQRRENSIPPKNEMIETYLRRAYVTNTKLI